MDQIAIVGVVVCWMVVLVGSARSTNLRVAVIACVLGITMFGLATVTLVTLLEMALVPAMLGALVPALLVVLYNQARWWHDHNR